MTVEIKEVLGAPILIFSIGLPHDPLADVVLTQRFSAELRQKTGKHVYRIIDLSQFSLSFDDLVLGMALDRSEEGGINDMGISTIYVGSGEMVWFGVNAFQVREQYGETNVAFVCSTVDEAVAFARTELVRSSTPAN